MPRRVASESAAKVESSAKIDSKPYGLVLRRAQILVKRNLLELKTGEEVAELVFFRSQVGAGMLAGARPAGNALDDANAGSLELRHFVGIIREQADIAQAERLQSFGGKFVVARVIRKSQPAIRFHGVEPGVLQFVGFQLIDQANAAPFLRQIQQHAGGLAAILRSENSSCARQSQRSDVKTSPVRHCEWTRTSGAFPLRDRADCKGPC